MKAISRFFAAGAIALGLTLAVTLSALPQTNRPGINETDSARAGQDRPPSPGPAAAAATSITAAQREEAYRANNFGVALLEQYKHKDGAEEFRRALKLNPQLNLARVNLAIALYNASELDEALREAQAAAAAQPSVPQPHYILGLIAKSQNRTEDAVKAFQRVLEIDSRDVGANVNFGQLRAQQRQYPEALAAFRTALAAEPYNSTAVYNLATTLLRAGERDEGQRMLRRFQALRESGAGTSIGQNYLEQGRYAEAVASTGAETDLIDRAVPDVSFVEATASVLSAAAVGSGKGTTTTAAAAIAATTSSSATSPKQAAPAGENFFHRRVAGDQMTNAARQQIAASLGGGVILFDYDGDGDLDLFDPAASEQRLYRNDNGKFSDVTSGTGALSGRASGIGVGAVAGDYDNDGRPDLFVLRYGQSTLYRNEGDGKFSDQTAAAAIPAYPYLSVSAAFVDVDHDGDLDIFIAGFADMSKTAAAQKAAGGGTIFPDDFAGAPNLLLRNNGNNTFADVTEAAKIAGPNRAVAVIPTDYDNRRDVDLLVVNYDAAPVLYKNMRDATFRNVSAEVGLDLKEAPVTAAAAGDANKDGYTDFYFGHSGAPGGTLALSDGQGGFRPQPITADASAGGRFDWAPAAAQFVDYDNDGLLDLVAISPSGSSGGTLRVWRNLGQSWVETSGRAVSAETAAAAAQPLPAKSIPRQTALDRTFTSGDTDGDGDTDIFVRSAAGPLRFLRNDGGNRHRSVRVELAGKVSNRSGVGAKIEARAGSLWQKLETYAATPAPAPADTIFGLGARSAPDVVRVLWPAGIVQAETELTAAAAAAEDGGSLAAGNSTAAARDAQTKESATPKLSPPAQKLIVTELDRKPSSCPYLFTWNGERFEFVTDFMGGGELGYWAAPGVRAAPDSDEYVRIRADQLRARDGRYEIRVTNELEEALFMDHLQLIAVAHPKDVEIYPNEGLGNPTSSSLKIYATRAARPPVAATDDDGRDVLEKVRHLDRQYPEGFRLHRIRGYADDHALTLDLGETNDKRTLLLLTGWTDYAFSSDNVAAAQSGMGLQPPALQVKDGQGRWQTIIENIGIPVGRPQTVVVDLTGKFLARRNREVRIRTNMRIYWDQIAVDTSDGDFPIESTRLAPRLADLNWRGFSAEVTPDKREPFGYDYTRVSFTSPWKTFPGRYTREGDVRELLQKIDDMFVVSRPGDEIAISFDAGALAPLAPNWTRTFLLYVDGFSKEMDINSASPDQVAPLPFHGMKSYPYAAPEAYPLSPAHRDYLDRYNTRVVAAPVTQLVSAKSPR